MIKTVLVPGAPWPDQNAKVASKPILKKSISDDEHEFVQFRMEKGTFMHIKQMGRKRTQIFKPPVFDSSMLDDARKQLESFETRKSVRKGIEKNLKGKNVR